MQQNVLPCGPLKRQPRPLVLAVVLVVLLLLGFAAELNEIRGTKQEMGNRKEEAAGCSSQSTKQPLYSPLRSSNWPASRSPG